MDAARNRKAHGMRIEGPEQELTYAIIGCAMHVHNALGPGLKEVHYHRAMSLEMERGGLSFEHEKCIEMEIDGAFVGLLYLDHLVAGTVIVEEKALPHLLTQEEVAQVVTYLAATGLRVGVLLNFGRQRLEYRRILPPKKRDEWQARIRRYVWSPRPP